jgi:hypothetical protein
MASPPIQPAPLPGRHGVESFIIKDDEKPLKSSVRFALTCVVLRGQPGTRRIRERKHYYRNETLAIGRVSRTETTKMFLKTKKDVLVLRPSQGSVLNFFKVFCKASKGMEDY